MKRKNESSKIPIIKLKKGLDIPISGAPIQRVTNSTPVRSVALIGNDYIGLKPELLLEPGARVKLGQPVIRDRSTPGVLITAPGCGTISAVHRGARRTLLSVVIELDGDEQELFDAWPAADFPTLRSAAVRENLVRSGLWTALRTRPFGRVPPINSAPAAIFVTAIDTNPLAADPEVVLSATARDFADGLQVLSRLDDVPIFVCTAPNTSVSVPNQAGIHHVAFSGPHPAGLVGTHIHFLHPVGPHETVWYLNYQDAIAIGRLFKTGRLSVERIVSLGGTPIRNPRLVATRLGANTDDLLRNELGAEAVRVVSGSILSGRRAAGETSFLGRYHLQVSVITESREREFLGWLMPGGKKFSANRMFLSSLLGSKAFDLTTSQHGSPRAMVPIGNFEKVMPLDVLSTPLLKSLLVHDTATAQALGCLELEEEDLDLCSFVCCSKYDYGEALRDCLSMIEATS